MGLDHRGIVSIVQIIVYVPLLIFAGILVARHGFSRESGWIFLAIFSLIRIVGAVLIIVIEDDSHPSSGLFSASSIVVSIGLTPLFFAIMGFLGIVAQRAPGLQDMIRAKSKPFRLIHVAIVVGLILSIVAASDLASQDSVESDSSDATTFHKVAGIIFAVVYLALAAIHAYCWIHRDQILQHRRKLLIGLCCALPFVGVRTLYTFIGSLQSFTSKFSPISGSLGLYVVMSVAMEFIAIFIYVVVGITIPLDIDSEMSVEGQPMPVLKVSHSNQEPQYAPVYQTR
ncbi:hypothetical protein SISSUDRAFT_1031032 [Sistotremastrum suecicum HHB10207 ss-3]|uniref:DUF7702 domain-containing protein n=1 Tax=Sistotremastrum suecicum HHB10207 ss-3 TaxID=1314776 RepID=A0A166GHS9_9AGAM|nr:hypothetical protein SISSUDRAFT_1031032 [Sistotremastrum suecicum HHB10207 ss-3]